MNSIRVEKNIRQYCMELMEEKGYISPVDILLKTEYLTKADYERWRFGKVEFLEKVCRANLAKLSRVNKVIRKVAEKENLKASWTAYVKYGKGQKEALRFSKSNNSHVEKSYATHYVRRKD